MCFYGGESLLPCPTLGSCACHYLVCLCVCGFKDLVIHSTAVNSKHSSAPSDCVVRSFIPMVAMKDREMEMKTAGSDSRKYHPPKKTTKSYLSLETNNVGVSVMQATLPTLKTMAWTHLPVKKDKSITSSGCSYYYQFLALRRVYKTAPYCISWSYPLPSFISAWRLSFRLQHLTSPGFFKALS